MRDTAKKYLLNREETRAFVEEILQTAGGDATAVIDEVTALFLLGYEQGREDAQEDIEYLTEDGLDISKVRSALYKEYDGKTFEDRIDEYVGNNDIESILRVVDTELLRIYNQGGFDGVEEAGNGGGVLKTWVTMMDDKVRDTHDYLFGMTIPLEDLFYTFDGDSALAPGGFELAENNVNCRCILEYSNY